MPQDHNINLTLATYFKACYPIPEQDHEFNAQKKRKICSHPLKNRAK